VTTPRGLRVLTRDRETGWGFTALVSTAYLLFLIWMQLHHEMLRDEVHSWTLSRLAQSFGELVTGDRVYEGHPPLWFWYLHAWSLFIKPAWGLQAATIAAAWGGAVLLLRYAPFPRFLKVLLLCTYYLGFEHTVMCRNYVLGWFLLCVFCALYNPVRVRYWAIAIAIGLLSLTSVYGLIMSLFLLMYYVADNVTVALPFRFPSSSSSPSFPRTLTLTASPRLVGGFALASAAILFCVVVVQPPDPNPFSGSFNFNGLNLDAIPDVLHRFAHGFVPLRPIGIAFWTSSIFPAGDDRGALVCLVGGGLALLAVLSLYPSWRLMLVYLGAVALMQFFQVTRYRGDPRHWGHYFTFFIAACWLLRSTFPKRRHLLSTGLLIVMAGVQVESFVAATVGDSTFVFSGGRQTAAFIRRSHLADLPIVAGPDWFVITVTGYLERPYISSETDEINETVVFHSRRRGFDAHRLLERAVEVSRERRSPVLLITIVGLPPPPPGATMDWLFTSKPGTVGDEVFSVYRVSAF